MFVAQIYNKLTRAEEDMEDLLTSNVFGIWRYLPADLGLVQFLKTARRLDGTGLTDLDNAEIGKLEFWPWMELEGAKGAEPDVLMEIILPAKHRLLVMIEAKYLSPKSSYPDESSKVNDQLGREMQILRTLARRQRTDQYVLIYVTAHTLMPKNDILESISELASKTGEDSSEHFLWATWRSLPAILSREILNRTYDFPEGYAKLLGDLNEIVHRLGLVFFEGFDCQGWSLGVPSWRFVCFEVVFKWRPISIGYYKFKDMRKVFLWQGRRRTNKTLWRFDSHGKTRDWATNSWWTQRNKEVL